MKIALLGATGPSGVQAVKEALARGHDVTAIVRNPEKLTEKHDKLKVRRFCYTTTSTQQ
jgi:putative NADH-flavin reductase